MLDTNVTNKKQAEKTGNSARDTNNKQTEKKENIAQDTYVTNKQKRKKTVHKILT